jgi:hypothetical protein
MPREASGELAGAWLIPSHAAGHVEAGDWPPDEAEAMAARLTAELLPEGTRTAGMEEARAHGSRAIALHVFGANTTARRLYETSGYGVTQLNMENHLERLTQN